MTCEELRGHVADVLTLPLSDNQTIQTLLSRVNGADPNQLLVAALSVARERPSQKIAELERDLMSSEQQRWQLEDEMRELQEQIKRLTRKCETKEKRR
jgi:septal ring factor EnvC (AmiA/AmiB activator)